MDNMLKLTVELPKSIIESSRDITLRIVLKDDDLMKTDLSFSTAETNFDFTVDNWKEKLEKFLSDLGFHGRPKHLIISAVNLAIESEDTKYIFSRLAKGTEDDSKEIQNKISNQINNNRALKESLLKYFGTKLTPLKLVETLTNLVESQIKNAP